MIKNNKRLLFRRRNLVFIVLGILAFLWVPPEAIDSSRYYAYGANNINPDLSLTDFILSNFIVGVDFVYYLFFYWCIKLNLPFQIVTGISIGLLYYQSFVLMDNIRSKYGISIIKQDDYLLKIFVILSVSFVTVFGISRNVTALVFFAYGLNSLIIERYKRAIIFFVIAIFTHVGLIIYLTILLIAFYWRSIHIRNIVVRRMVLLIITLIGINSYLFMNQLLSNFAKFDFFTVFVYYAKFLNAEGAINVFNWGLGKWDTLMFFTSATSLFYALFFIKKYNPVIWICFFFYLWLVISMGFSQMFTQRTVIFLILIQGVAASFFFSQHKNTLTVSIYRVILLFSILAFFLNVYGYRDAWEFVIP